MPTQHDANHLRPAIGVIGGSGLYAMAGVTDLVEVSVETPFGAPSDALLIGRVDGVPVAFLPRHGRGHRVPPHQINYRANIWAMKSVGVSRIFSVSAVGSLREDIAPGDLVLVDQFIDRTRNRPSTFLEDGVVGHVSLADPVCPVGRALLLAACREVAASGGCELHDGGAYVCIDGPAFSTRAESHMFRSWGAAVVGMTNLPEARLAREAEIGYATLAMATDYDCWHPDHAHVTVDAVVAVMKANVANAQAVLRHAIKAAADAPQSPAWRALDHAIMTTPHLIPAATRARLAPILARLAAPGGPLHTENAP
jgi:5'-methylthioadenosine phosphorylase